MELEERNHLISKNSQNAFKDYLNLYTDFKEIKELDMNPVLGYGDKERDVEILDVRIGHIKLGYSYDCKLFNYL